MDDTPAEPTSDDTIQVALPSNLTTQIDAQIGSAFIDRDDFIRSAVRFYLEHIRQTQGTANKDIG